MRIHHVGIAGLGLLGRGIVACLLGHGYRVTAFDNNPAAFEIARAKVGGFVAEMADHGVCAPAVASTWRDRYAEVHTVEDLGRCDLVIESIVEDPEQKKAFYAGLEAVAAPGMPIASNTSAIPVTLIQEGTRHPERFMGMHWGEPAHIMAFMELIRGPRTSDETYQTVHDFARSLDKDPTLVKRDIRGFVGNRMYFALLREAFYLLESGVADIEEIDRSWRTSAGWWALYTGPFRNMDLTGIEVHARVMKDLFPELCNATTVPATIQKIVDEGRGGVGTLRGFYSYTPKELERWEERWDPFTWDVRALAEKYGDLHDGPMPPAP